MLPEALRGSREARHCEIQGRWLQVPRGGPLFSRVVTEVRVGHEIKSCACVFLGLRSPLFAGFPSYLGCRGQTIDPPEVPSFDKRWLSDWSPGQKDPGSSASFHVGWMTVPNRIRVGYDGLVRPGACVSSFFVYPLSGVQVGGRCRYDWRTSIP